MPTLTTAEVAKILQVTPRWVRKLRDRIGGFEIKGGVLLFDQRAVERFKASRERKGKNA